MLLGKDLGTCFNLERQMKYSMYRTDLRWISPQSGMVSLHFLHMSMQEMEIWDILTLEFRLVRIEDKNQSLTKGFALVGTNNS